MQQVADEHGLSLAVGLPTAGTSAVAQQQQQHVAAPEDFSSRLAELRR